jgi:hypothetical protein
MIASALQATAWRATNPVMPNLTEQLIAIHGEQYRIVIESALKWLEETEPLWELDEPIDKPEFIRDLIDHIAK